MSKLEGKGQVVGSIINDFKWPDQNGEEFHLKGQLNWSNIMFVFYPGGFIHPVCTTQLCDYRDHFENFQEFDLKIVCVSGDSPETHSAFATKNNYPFIFLSDPKKEIAKAYGCQSALMLGGVSRAVCIVHQKGKLLYRYVEPTPLTRRGSDELLAILRQMRDQSVI